MKKSMMKRVKDRANRQQVVILALMLIPDAFAIALSAVTAYMTRFTGDKNFIASSVATAQFEYRGILFWVVVAWIFSLILTGTLTMQH